MYTLEPQSYPWFAWYPVKTTDTDRWVWLEWITRVEDERPLAYLGLLPRYYYYEIN